MMSHNQGGCRYNHGDREQDHEDQLEIFDWFMTPIFNVYPDDCDSNARDHHRSDKSTCYEHWRTSSSCSQLPSHQCTTTSLLMHQSLMNLKMMMSSMTWSLIYIKKMMLILHQSLMCIWMVILIVWLLNPDACFNVKSYYYDAATETNGIIKHSRPPFTTWIHWNHLL